jgi:hypothetical protein
MRKTTLPGALVVGLVVAVLTVPAPGQRGRGQV